MLRSRTQSYMTYEVTNESSMMDDEVTVTLMINDDIKSKTSFRFTKSEYTY